MNLYDISSQRKRLSNMRLGLTVTTVTLTAEAGQQGLSVRVDSIQAFWGDYS